MPRGTLYFVVGPSCAGKDTLIEKACIERPDLYVMPRTITRPAPDGDHVSISEDEFAKLKRGYGFSLNWDANGVRYGIPRDLEARLEDGQSVIVNGSRSIVTDVQTKFEPVKIINVTARFDVLARRLRERGRETNEEIELRLGRADRSIPKGEGVVNIDNSGSLEDSVPAFVAALA